MISRVIAPARRGLKIGGIKGISGLIRRAAEEQQIPLRIWLDSSVGKYSDAGITPTISGGTIREWHDQSGNNHHAIQSGSSTLRPIHDTAFGFDTVVFPGAQQFNIQNYHWEKGSIFIVCNPGHVGLAEWRGLFGHQDASSPFSIRYLQTNQQTGNPGQIGCHSPSSASAKAFKVYGDFVIFQVDFALEERKTDLYINGVLMDSVTNLGSPLNTVNYSLPMLLGGYYYNSVPADRFVGHISDVLIYDDVVSLTQQQQKNIELRASNTEIRSYSYPANVTDVGLWLAADDLAYAGHTALANDNESVFLWKNKADYTNAFQANTSQRPLFRLVDGIKALYFDGNDFMYHNYFGDYGTCFIVAKLTSNSNTWLSLMGAYGGSTLANAYFRSSTTSGQISCALSGMPTVNTLKIYNEWYLLSVRFDNATGVEMSINGIVVAQGGAGSRTPVPQNGAEPPVIGATYYSGNPVDEHIGYIAEVIVAPNRLDDTPYNNILSYLQTKYTATATNISSPYTTGLQTHWDSTQGVYKDAGVTLAAVGDNVQQWNDLSGNGYHATQATGTNQPKLSTVDGINVVETDGIDDWLQHSYTGEPATIYIVLKSTRSGLAWERVLGANSSTHSWGWTLAVNRINTSTMDMFRRDLSPAQTTRIADSWFSLTGTYNSASKARSIYVDGVLKQTQTSTGTVANITTPAAIGASMFSGAPGHFFKGYIAEILIYNVVHTPLEQLAMWDYLKNKWSVL